MSQSRGFKALTANSSLKNPHKVRTITAGVLAAERNFAKISRKVCKKKGMSALPPKADMCIATPHVCFGPKADICHLFDHFVRDGDDTRRNGEAERLGRGEIDNKLEFG